MFYGETSFDKGACFTNKQIPAFDMLILSDISKSPIGLSKPKILSTYGKEGAASLEFLEKSGMIQEHTQALAPFMPSGSGYVDPPIGNLILTEAGELEVKRWSTKDLLTRKERWKERLIGFLSALLLWALQTLITQIFLSGLQR